MRPKMQGKTGFIFLKERRSQAKESIPSIYIEPPPMRIRGKRRGFCLQKKTVKIKLKILRYFYCNGRLLDLQYIEIPLQREFHFFERIQEGSWKGACVAEEKINKNRHKVLVFV